MADGTFSIRKWFMAGLGPYLLHIRVTKHTEKGNRAPQIGFECRTVRIVAYRTGPPRYGSVDVILRKLSDFVGVTTITGVHVGIMTGDLPGQIVLDLVAPNAVGLSLGHVFSELSPRLRMAGHTPGQFLTIYRLILRFLVAGNTDLLDLGTVELMGQIQFGIGLGKSGTTEHLKVGRRGTVFRKSADLPDSYLVQTERQGKPKMEYGIHHGEGSHFHTVELDYDAVPRGSAHEVNVGN